MRDVKPPPLSRRKISASTGSGRLRDGSVEPTRLSLEVNETVLMKSAPR